MSCSQIQIWYQISYRGFEPQLAKFCFASVTRLDYKFMEEGKCRNLVASLDEVSDELHDLGQLTSYLPDSVYS